GIRDRNVTGVQTCALPIFDLVTTAPPKVDLSLGPGGQGSSNRLTRALAARFASQFSLQFAAAWDIDSARLVNVSVAYSSATAATDRKSVVEGKGAGNGRQE